MELARSTFYDEPVHWADGTARVAATAAICEEFGYYGWRRVRAALRLKGLTINHKKICRLMREHGLQPRLRRRFLQAAEDDEAAELMRCTVALRFRSMLAGAQGSTLRSQNMEGGGGGADRAAPSPTSSWTTSARLTGSKRS